MTILNLFLDFINKILSIEILGISLDIYLITFTILIFVFKIINLIGNGTGKHKKPEE